MQRISDHAPVSSIEFAAAAAAIIGDKPFAVAVSGGADSLALLVLAQEWCRSANRQPPHAVTVDHGLRSESAEEAARVATWSASLGVPHKILKWDHPPDIGNVQSEARDARYSLIGNWMHESGIETLSTGHTLDDQAETFLIRLSRGSGLEGLSGMKTVSEFPVRKHRNLKLARPLLAFSHGQLIATLTARGLGWLEDPSNTNTKYLRTQIRNALPLLAELGLTPLRLSATASHLRRANNVIVEEVAALTKAALQTYPWGYGMLKLELIGRAPEEIALRVLSQCLRTFGGGQYAPEFEKTKELLLWMRQAEPDKSGRTLAGCRMIRRSDGLLLMAREETSLSNKDKSERLHAGQSCIWDGRFHVAIPPSAGPGEFQVVALGLERTHQLGQTAEYPPHEPKRVASACPAIVQADQLISVPNLNFHKDFEAEARFLGLEPQ